MNDFVLAKCCLIEIKWRVKPSTLEVVKIISSIKFLKINNPIMPNAIPFKIPLERGFMIDTEAEFKIAESMFKQKRKK